MNNNVTNKSTNTMQFLTSIVTLYFREIWLVIRVLLTTRVPS